jgi:uncharacterized damage-inducible protein DinB
MTLTSKSAMSRRSFFRMTAASSVIAATLPLVTTASPTLADDDVLVIQPLQGYSPQIGTLVSMLNYNRYTILKRIKSLTQEQLDHLFDPKSNTIGALVMHLGATEKFYQINTFEGRQEFNAEEEKIWGAAMELGDKGRAQIKGHNVSYYIEMITKVREETLRELKKKDDEWLLAKDPVWSKKQPVNTYWKWFHVCEHESNHRGQIAWLQGRLPGATPGKD